MFCVFCVFLLDFLESNVGAYVCASFLVLDSAISLCVYAFSLVSHLLNSKKGFLLASLRISGVITRDTSFQNVSNYNRM